MRDCRTFHLDTIGMRRLDGGSAHGITRHKAVARSDGAVQELFGVFLRNFRIQQCVHKPMLDKHGGCNINQSRCRGKFLKLRRRLGDERRIGIQVAQTPAYNHVVDAALRQRH